MNGVCILKGAGLARLHCSKDSVGATVAAGLIIGAGFQVPGFCPGTAAGAVRTGDLDAVSRMAGIVPGAEIFAHVYPYIDRSFLNRGRSPAVTIPERVHVQPEWVVVMVAILIVGIPALLAGLGFLI